MQSISFNGLTEEQVTESKKKYGSNSLSGQEEKIWLKTMKDIVSEPMFILLLSTCFIYLVLGEWKEGVIMGISLILVAGISFYQEHRSRGAVDALRKLSAPRAVVWRSGLLIGIAIEELVVDDIVKIEEGEIIPADGFIMTCNDLSVNESILTGESMAVLKNAVEKSQLFRGTLVISGNGWMQITSVGNQTQLGKIGMALRDIQVEKTPLQLQISHFVKYMAWIGGVAFAIIVSFSYYQTHDWLQSLLSGLTLAMSILPQRLVLVL
jgi:Ca2+-transporting ATPase